MINEKKITNLHTEISLWGALIQRAEIIPIEPDPDNTGEGTMRMMISKITNPSPPLRITSTMQKRAEK